MPFSVDQKSTLPLISQEEKMELLINKNRQALEFRLQLQENHAVDISEDSMSSDMLPHSNPP